MRELTAVLKNRVKSFVKGNLLDNIRKKPSILLCEMMLLRVQNWDQKKFNRRVLNGMKLENALNNFIIPGRNSNIKTYWVFPVIVVDTEGLIKNCRDHGFDASQKHSLLILETDDKNNLELFSSLVYLPFDMETKTKHIDKLISIVNQI